MIGGVCVPVPMFLAIDDPKSLRSFRGRNFGLLVLVYFLYQYVNEAQDKCEFDELLHNFGELFRIVVISSGVLTIVSNSMLVYKIMNQKNK